MYCPNCKKSFDGKFCPECGTELIEEPMAGASLSLGDANAISGDLNVSTTNNVQNVDNSVTNIDNTVKNIDQRVTNIDQSVHNTTQNIDQSVHNTTQNVTHNVTNITQVAASEEDVALAAEKATEAIAASETRRAEADIMKEQRHQQEIADAKRKSKIRTYVVSFIVLVALAALGTGLYLKVMTGKSVARLASEAAYNSINSENIEDIDVSTADVPSDDPSVVIDPNGDVKAQLESHYEFVYALNAGFYRLKDKGKYGLADASGKIIQKPKYDEMGTKNKNGLIKITDGDKIGFLNLKGVEVLKPKYTSIEEPADGLIKVAIGDLFGFLDANTLKEVAPCQYTYIYSLQDGKYKVMIGSKEGYLDENGNVIQEPK